MERRVRRLENQMDSWRAGTVIDVKLPDPSNKDFGSGGAPYSNLCEALESIVTDKNPAPVAPSAARAPSQLKWLYSAQLNSNPREIWESLEYGQHSYVELNVDEWQCEEDLWLSLLRGVAADAAMHEQEAKGHKDSLDRLRKLGADCLLEVSKVEVCFVLKGVPGKHDAAKNPVGLRLVAVFVASVANAWKALEDRDASVLGRVSVVLCGREIGMNLRAGDKKFKIEPLC